MVAGAARLGDGRSIETGTATKDGASFANDVNSTEDRPAWTRLQSGR